LVDLGGLHVLVIDVVSLDFLVDAVMLVILMHIIQQLMSLSELVNHESLKLDDINHVKKSFYLIEDHDAKLIGYAAVAVISHYQKEGLDNLASYSGTHIL
jgi:hypothetical protein